MIATAHLCCSTSSAEKILIYMDLAQMDHLRSYGVAYWALEQDWPVEWLLNYRGGSFLMDQHPEIEKRCRIDGVTYTVIGGVEVARIYDQIQNSNMDNILLEKAPRVAVYIPDNKEPWDDAVTLALEYAKIPYEKVWDAEVLKGRLTNYDWLHLHHEDFTGQFGKFYASFRNTDWYKKDVAMNTKTARRFGFKKVSQLKHAVAQTIKRYVGNGGFLFSMCSATDTYDIALAAGNVDIVASVYDGDPPDPDCEKKLDYSKTFVFTDFKLVLDPLKYEHSDIDVTSTASIRGPDTYFSLFEFSAKYDPVPTMLTQDHVSLVKEFLGQNSGFNRKTIKKSVVVMAEVLGTEEIKYVHGNFGMGTFTFLGGHDPEDYQHMVGDPPTRLELHKNSPGYRLILNNILFPAAKKKEQKT
ncbi:asparagine synthetase B [candidate division TA06 bacterium]|uniref:Asparagine synthetase B n=1 Tax=candidate division TA06 bacterium TaxID=2250710 RepID=A0A523XQR8_UNCT6|nr:MAG: asparagine synthetase B [candidate division TA06 bacterium]